MASGIEPDQCFYIQSHQAMRGKKRIDLTVDPPPDLAIEVDVTSKTQLDAYRMLGVPELWRYENNRRQINILQASQYQEAQISPTFPNLPVVDLISEAIEQSAAIGRSPALRSFRTRVRQML
jgi:Uma2 family endonuclease